MAIIPNLADIPEKKPVDGGEYDLRITKVKETKSQRTGRYGCMLVIEIDGGYHFTRLQQEKDRNRTLGISKYKVDVIRFTNMEVIDDYEITIEKIDSIVKERLKTSTL